jgi:4-hydroxy-3-methylbut-2-enyl diphosphate reductase
MVFMRRQSIPNPSVNIEVAPTIGFCGGVGKAIRMLECCAKNGIRVETLGPVVHNRQVVERLEGLGISNTINLEGVKGSTVGITAHGTDPATLQAIKSRNLKMVDTTCPIVRHSQRAAAAMARSGFRVLIFGDPSHPEVQGLLGWSGPDATATLDADVTGEWKIVPKYLGIISQTTQSHASYKDFVCSVLEKLFSRLEEVRTVNTICAATQTRQALTAEMASRNDLMIVVGGNQSANTRRLAETAKLITETRLIEDASSIELSWLKGHNHIGIIAGTSTPKETVSRVVDTVRELTCN